MLSTKETILVALYATIKKEEETQKVYSHYSRSGRVEEFLSAMTELYKEGAIQVPYKSWSPHGETTKPDDVVMTGVKLTDYGLQKAQELEQELRERLK